MTANMSPLSVNLMLLFIKKVKATVPRRPGDKIELFWLLKKNGGHFTRFKSKNYS